MSKEFPGNLYKKIKTKAKTAATVGMAMMAFSGAGDFEKIRGRTGLDDIDTETKTRTASLEKDNQTFTLEEEKRAIDSCERLLRETRESKIKLGETTREERNPKSRAEKIRNEIRKHVGSEEYLNKLKKEVGGDVERAMRIQKERLGYLDSVKFNFSDRRSLRSKFHRIVPDDVDLPIPDWMFKLTGKVGVRGFYRPMEKKIFLPTDGAIRDNDETAWHEIDHASTLGSMGVTEEAEKLLDESYEETGKKDRDAYLRQTAERLVRKHAFDLEMEKLGIKKYSEEFTDEHYDKLLQAFKEGKFSDDVIDFFLTTKSGPEYYKKIFNEIAINKSGESDSAKHA